MPLQGLASPAIEPLACVRAHGFTLRQARFLVLVLEHSGVCLPRQYRAFVGIAHGRQAHRFFEQLIRGGFATTDLAAPAHAGRIFHLQYKPWYRALGEPGHRHPSQNGTTGSDSQRRGLRCELESTQRRATCERSRS